jgi:DNA helicase-2/ATP-dependent DNA helicase PcrA
MAGSIIDEIKTHINNGHNFLLSGGAGSGKTYTLMQVLDLIHEKNPVANIACITYTNVAVDEIKSRSPYENLRVSTIHDFLWDVIKSYQQNLKKALCDLIDLCLTDNKAGIKYEGEYTLNIDYFIDKTIEYRDYRKLEEGIIWHDDVLKIAYNMFDTYPLLCDIIKDKFQYILVDEYQDTDKQVVEIFLNFFQKNKKRQNVLAFFGDSMQAIYDAKGIGNLKSYVNAGIVREVKKEDNYRCSEKVIELINKIRIDGIVQKAAKNNKHGKITFLYTNKNEVSIARIKKENNVFKDWNFNNADETKELYLTHRLIAREYGFEEILNKYTYPDNLLGDEAKRDRIANHLFKIQEIIYLYDKRKYNDLITKTNYKIRKLSDKSILRDKIEELRIGTNNSIEELINLADKHNLIIKDDKFNDSIRENEDSYNSIKALDRNQIEKVYHYVEGHSPYSTQHGVKGAEFENVFVILDNGRWNQYNFQYLFEETAGKENIIERTRKIFYVCCSRSKNNLVVFYHKPSFATITKAKVWFGVENVCEI